MKRATLLTILLLTPGLAFGQKFQDVTTKGAPVSLRVKADYPDMDPYVAVHNSSGKGILAFIALIKSTDEHGQVAPCESRADYIFKFGALASQEERFACPLEASDPAAKIVEAVGAVLFVQFEDGSTWGDPEAGKEMLAERPQKLAFLKHLVEVYDASGEAAFTAALDETKLQRPLRPVAGCLKGDAGYEKVPVIDLARKRLAAAQSWQTAGIF